MNPEINGVIAVDIGSFIVAFVALQYFIKIPESKSERKESVLILAKEGIGFLKDNPMIMTLILFMAGVYKGKYKRKMNNI